MKRDDTHYLQHIADALAKIGEYTEGIDKVTFKKNTMIQDAVIRQLMVIGEAIKNLSEPTKLTQADIPWREIAGMRDVLVHQYFGVDIDIVWLTVKDKLPELNVTIRQMVSDLSS